MTKDSALLEFILNRIARRETYTIGRLYANGVYICDTIEDRDRGLDISMSEDAIRRIKVYGETAIPTGRYRVTLTVSEKFKSRVWAKITGGLVPLINNVPGFSGIRIHPMNTAEDSLGCIGPGENKVVGKVINSTEAYAKLMDGWIIPAWNSGNDIFITIK